jgi:hypothetical protein
MWTSAELDATLPRQIVTEPTWKFSASHNPSIAYYALGIQPWTSGARQAPGMWWQVELPQARTVSELQFESNPAPVIEGEIVAGAPSRSVFGAAGEQPGLGYPRGYQVQVSMDGSQWTTVAEGKGTGADTHVVFAPTQARFVRLTSTTGGDDLPPLSILRLRLFEPGTAQ